MDTLKVVDITGKEIEKKKLKKEWLEEPINNQLLRSVLLMYQANKRQGTVSSKTRSEVAATGAKPWRQKGTGRARAGTSSSPVWRGGGVAFGPKPRSFGFTMPKKMKRKARDMALRLKLQNSALIAVKDLTVSAPKTKEVATILGNLKITGTVLFILDEKNESMVLASRNIKGVHTVTKADVNTRDLLVHDTVLVADKAITDLLENALSSSGSKPAAQKEVAAEKIEEIKTEEKEAEKEEKQDSK